MALTPEQVATVARLSRLQIRDEEVPGVCDRLSRILDFVAQLERAETADVPPMSFAENAAQRMRDDVAVPVAGRDEFQRNAAATDGGLYLVPKVIE